MKYAREARVIYSTADFLIYQKDISLKCIQIPPLSLFPSLSLRPCSSSSGFLRIYTCRHSSRLRLLCVARSAVIRNALIYRRSCEQTQTGQNRPSILIYLERRRYTKFLYLFRCPSAAAPRPSPPAVRVVRRWRGTRSPAKSIY